MPGQLEKQTILVVDDNAQNIDVLVGILGSDYRIKAAINGERALRIATGNDPPDLILLDVMMPEMNGYEVCQQLKSRADTKQIPVIFVTAKDEIEDESRGFAAGCADYITKPISPPLVKARVETHLAMHNQNRVLEEKVRQRTKELVYTRDVTILGLAVLAEYRDNETGAHIMRTKHYVRALARHLASKPKFREYLDEEMIELLFKSTPLHDIGKVGVPDSILLKPGPLNKEEFEEMKRHTIYGRDALMRAEKALGANGGGSTFLQVGKEIAHSHHEKWDGSGYPDGLKGEEIPLPGRLVAMADVYDALISRRVYKPPYPHPKAVEIITEGDGRVEPDHFDPDILEAFKALHDEFHQIALKYADHEEDGSEPE